MLAALAMLVVQARASAKTIENRKAPPQTPYIYVQARSIFDVQSEGNDKKKRRTYFVRDLVGFGGVDLNNWPYIERGEPSSSGYREDMNFVVPEGSRFGWRFITRAAETAVRTRATIDAEGNASFLGSLSARGSLEVGVAGSYTPAALTWGNHLGGDSLSTLFSSDSSTVQGVYAKVFGISYSGVPVMAQDAYGNLGVFGDVSAKRLVSATSLKIGGVTVTSGDGAPAAACAAGDLYLRSGNGATLYTCSDRDTWSAVGNTRVVEHNAAPPVQSNDGAPIFTQAPFSTQRIASSIATTVATVSTTLGDSVGPHRNWYVCAIVEATTESESAAMQNQRLTLGIASTTGGVGEPFRMYSHARNDTKDDEIGPMVLSDWRAEPDSETHGRYCNSYDNGAKVAYSAVLLKPKAEAPVFASGQIEIQAFQR